MGSAVLTASDAAWPWPVGVTSLTAESLGGAGAGGDATNNPAYCGGGKGASYAKKAITKTVSTLDITVAGVAAASIIVQNSVTELSAAGGASVAANGATGATALVGSNIGDLTYEGGNGGGSTGTSSGGGGGAAGPGGVGGAASGTTAGLANTSVAFLDGNHYGGTSGAGVAVRNVGNAGTNYGAAGSGGSTNQNADKIGGAGTQGVVVLTWDEPAVDHATTGALTGQGSTVAGTATRFRAHAATGALTGPGAAVVGTARHNIPHATSGALTGQGSTVAGSAARTRVHAATGTLTGPGSVLDGVSARTRQHATSGVLTGPGAALAGTADRQDGAGGPVTHATTGALTGPGAVVVGSAARTRAHAATGALSGPGAVIAGSAARTRVHGTSGTLAGAGAVVAGSAERIGLPVTHEVSGALTGAGALLAGSAEIEQIVVPADAPQESAFVVFGESTLYSSGPAPVTDSDREKHRMIHHQNKAIAMFISQLAASGALE